MSPVEVPASNSEELQVQRLTTALTEAIGTVVEQQGPIGRPIELKVTVRGAQVSVSATSLSSDGAESFASWLKDRLDRERLTKVAAAHRLGVSERTVRRWLAGDTEPRFQELLRISSLLGDLPV